MAIERTTIADLAQLLDSFSRGNERRIQSISLQQQGVENILNSAQTKEQLDSALRALENIKTDSNEYSATSLNQQAVRNAYDNKRAAFDDFETAVEQADDFFKSDKYKSKSSDWTNLDDTRKSLNESGLNYDSNLEMVSEEFIKIATLKNKIGTGAALFRLPKIGDGTFDEDQIVSKINDYQNTLDKALTSMIEDEVITEEEAENIVTANFTKQDVKTLRNEKKAMFTGLIKESDSIIKSLQSQKFDLMSGDDLVESLMNIGIEQATAEIAGGQVSEGRITAQEQIEQLIELEQQKNNRYRNNYKDAVGYFYAAEETFDPGFDDAANEGDGGVFTVDPITGEQISQEDGEISTVENQKDIIVSDPVPSYLEPNQEGASTPGPLRRDDFFFETLEKEGFKSTFDKVESGELSADTLIKFVENTPFAIFANTINNFFKQMPDENAKVPQKIKEVYEEFGIPVPNLKEFLKNYPTVDMLEKAFAKKNPKIYKNFTEQQKRNNRLFFKNSVLPKIKNSLNPKLQEAGSDIQMLGELLEGYTNLDKQISGESLKQYLADDLSMMQAVKKGTEKELAGKKIKRSSLSYNESRQLNSFKRKYEMSGLSLEDFINENQMEFRNMALIIKYGLQVLPRRRTQV